MQNFFFIAFPYIALILAVGVGLYRYYSHRFTYSSLSSQLLENRQLFWGSVPWHYGITLILLAHLLPWLFPRTAAAVLGNSTRLLVLELTGLALGFYCVFGIIVLIARRLPNDSRARAVTSPMDWILLLVLAFQVLSGVGVALFERWGALWYLSTAVPWLWSLVRLHPDTSTVTGLPVLIQAHILSGFVVILLFPFTRLVHVFAIPIEYLWRPYQVVIWNSDPHRVDAPPLPKPAVLRAPPSEPADPERRRVLTRLGILVGSISAAIVGIPSIGFLLGSAKSPGGMARSRECRQLSGRRDGGGLVSRFVAAALVGCDRQNGRVAAERESAAVHSVRYQLHTPRLPGALAPQRGSVHVPVSWRGVL